MCDQPREDVPVITVALADHYHLVRQGIRCLLEGERDLEIVGEVADGLKVIDLVKWRKPRVLVVSLGMPGLNGFEVTRRVCEHAPETGVIVLSMYGHDQYVIEALRRGASRYVVTQTNGTELIQISADRTEGNVCSLMAGDGRRPRTRA